MTRQPDTDREAIDLLWSQLDDAHVAMLSLRHSTGHPQPMTVFAKRDDNAVWFITSDDTELSKDIGEGAEGQLTVMNKGGDFQASVQGQMTLSRDQAKLDELWSVMAAAWFEHGRDDPHVCLIRFEPGQAALWATQGNKIMAGIKIARAGMTDGEDHPDVGTYRMVDLKAA